MKGFEIKLGDYVPKGEIEGFPIEVVEKMVKYQIEEDGGFDIDGFEEDRMGGFTWKRTPEGKKFWGEVIINKNFDLFFSKYPKEGDCKEDTRDDEEKLYKVEPSDLKGQLGGWPIGIVQKMIDNQFHQNGFCDVSIFQNTIVSTREDGGFSWEDSSEGYKFWESTLAHGGIKHIKDVVDAELKTRMDKEFPKVMYVATNEDVELKYYVKRVVIAIKNGTAIAWSNAESEEEAKDEVNTSRWDCFLTVEKYKELTDEKVLMTLSEVEEKLGIEKGRLRIKE